MNNLQYAEYLSDDELQKVAPLLKRLKKLEDRSESQDDFLKFVNKISRNTRAQNIAKTIIWYVSIYSKKSYVCPEVFLSTFYDRL